ncbi:hypothetical protein SAE02_10880 [Skermanella aerolata]|uniref:Uncharacterized protein n=1 Tax=Skermanella aerolata TaxID=393310 RepID=A0A512DL74_9PROT|nr:hypothetical protein SAE02_10880 [Skermanella aerolata]
MSSQPGSNPHATDQDVTPRPLSVREEHSFAASVQILPNTWAWAAFIEKCGPAAMSQPDESPILTYFSLRLPDAQPERGYMEIGLRRWVGVGFGTGRTGYRQALRWCFC